MSLAGDAETKLDLVLGHFEGSLDKDQERELHDELQSSKEFRELFLSHMRLEGRLHSLGRDGLLSSELTPEANPTSDRAMRSRLLSPALIVACAASVFFAMAWISWPANLEASDVLRHAQSAAAELADRTYSLVIKRRENSRKAQDFDIHLRGGGRFVIAPRDGRYVMGCDGSDFWLAKMDGPVWVTSDYRSLEPEIQRWIPNRTLLDLVSSPDEPLLLDPSSLVRLLRNAYSLELLESRIPDRHHIRAMRKASRRGGPVAVDVWFDAGSGVVLKASLAWDAGQCAVFEFESAKDRPSGWYGHRKHVFGRTVERIEP